MVLQGLPLLVLFALAAHGKKCFECQDAAHPYDCRKVVDCATSDICFVDQVITTGGLILFDSGCRPQVQCQQSRKPGIVARADILTCSECCDADYCNQNGCGHTAPDRTSRGPYCYTCDNQLSPSTCRSVSLCSTDQKCLLTYSDIDKFFTSRCAPQTQCGTVQATIVGRSTVHGQSCHTCCDQDFCNDNCTQALLVTNGHWSTWGGWSSCSATCGQRQRSRLRTCDNPAPENGGHPCVEDAVMVQNCSDLDCQSTTEHSYHPGHIDGHWSDWGEWSSCSLTCGQGQGHKTRSRTCDNPGPQSGGCTGSSVRTANCSTHVRCPVSEESCRNQGYEWHVAGTGLYGCLKLWREPHVWTGARHRCHVNQSELFVAYNPSKQALLKSFLMSKNVHGTEVAWLGLQVNTALHTWRWSSPTHPALTFSHFHIPSDVTAGHGCAIVFCLKHDCYWSPKKCFTHHYVLCEMLHIPV